MIGLEEKMYKKVPVKTNTVKLLIRTLRDTGYTTPDCINELVDNSIDAGAKNVDVILLRKQKTTSKLGSFIIVDDGLGMDETELEAAFDLGTDRFYQKNSLGNYGLGMITGAISSGKRLAVFSSQKGRPSVNLSCLDLDVVEIQGAAYTTQRNFTRKQLEQEEATLKPELGEGVFERLLGLCTDKNSGTISIVSKLDRVTQRMTTVKQEIEHSLGTVYRVMLDEGKLNIFCNDKAIVSYDFCNFNDEKTVRLSGNDNKGFRSMVFTDPNTGVGYSFSYRATYQPPRTTGSGGSKEDRKRSGKQGISVIRNGREILSGKTFGLYAKTTNSTGWIVELNVDSQIAQDLIGIKFSKNGTTIPNRLINEDFAKYIKNEIVIPCRNIVYLACNKQPSFEVNKVYQNAQTHVAGLEALTKALKGLPDREKVSRKETEGQKASPRKSGSDKKPRKTSMKRDDISLNFELADWHADGPISELDVEPNGKDMTLLVNKNHSFYLKYMSGAETDNALLSMLWAGSLSKINLIQQDDDMFFLPMKEFNDMFSHNLSVMSRI